MSFSRRDFVKSSLAVALTPSLLSCGDSSTQPDLVGPRFTARPGIPSLDPTIGFSRLGLGSGRDGVLYVPASYAAGTPIPLFVALHGAGGLGSNWSSYYDRAESHGFVLLAPDSRLSTWDLIASGYGPDIQLLDGAFEHVFDSVAIDPTRIAFGGFSDGASYAVSLGVSNGDLFTHLVAYSPGFFLGAEPFVGSPSVFVSHGTDDTILPVALSREQIVPSLRMRGYSVRFDEFDGGHEVPAAITETALDWFLS